jgi:hypothetical protein
MKPSCFIALERPSVETPEILRIFHETEFSAGYYPYSIFHGENLHLPESLELKQYYKTVAYAAAPREGHRGSNTQ